MTKESSRKLTFREIYHRALWDNPDAANWLLFAIFVVCAIDEVGRWFGIIPHALVLFAATYAGFYLVLLVCRPKDLFLRRLKLFRLRADEAILAARYDELVLVTDTAQIQSGALRGVTNLVLVNTRPWAWRRLECVAASVKLVLTISLELNVSDPQKIRHWIGLEDSDVENDIRRSVTKVVERLGREVVLESPYKFRAAVESEINSGFLASLGVMCRVFPVEDKDVELVDQNQSSLAQR
jgi:hypothetical protein